MAVADERAAYLALALTPGIGPARLRVLLQHCGSATGVLAAPVAFLRSVPGISGAAATAIKAASLRSARRALKATRVMHATCLFPDDPEYPADLRDIADPPAVLFALGRREFLARPAVAIVGSRDHTEYGAQVCREIAGAAARAGIAVVSGMARGLDAVAHAAALDAGGATIGILGNGLGVVYPAANRGLYRRVADHGLLLTEFPPGERPGVGSFPRRNRLISALARVTVVVEAAEGSGTLITVGAALAQGRDVMAVPGNITSSRSVGTNGLIRDGAEPLLGPEDLLAHYPEIAVTPSRGQDAPPRPASAPPPALPPEASDPERRLFEALAAAPGPVDELIVRAGLPTAEALAALSGLELRGLVRQESGGLRLA